MKLVMLGAMGRMGRRIIALSTEQDDIEIFGAVDVLTDGAAPDAGEMAGVGTLGVQVTHDLRSTLDGADVVVDFTSPDATMASARMCGEAGMPFVTGTTGLTADQHAEISDLMKGIPCVIAPNMSVGVNVLFMLAEKTAAVLGEEYDIEITEAHHRFKKDAPSGTAARLAEIIADTLDTPLSDNAVYGRQGIIGERPRKEIAIHALRIGDVVGEHTVSFGTLGERIELVHKAQSRDALASGALLAARFVVAAEPGIYDMRDVLGLKEQF
jgi:4-hydroxy-tetrahydrodipicolinate reductase